MKIKLLLLAITVPVLFAEAADFYSTTSQGNWSSPSTWWLDKEGQQPATSAPTADDTVYIFGEVTIDFSSNYTHHGNIFILGRGESDL